MLKAHFRCMHVRRALQRPVKTALADVWDSLCRELIHEEKAGSIEYRSTFGTQRVGGFIANAFDLYLKNPANTNVVEWGKRLLALWEVCMGFTEPKLLHTTCAAMFWTVLSNACPSEGIIVLHVGVPPVQS